MPDTPNVVDVTDEPASRVQAAAFHALRDIQPGRPVVLLTADDPASLMRSLDLQLGGKLAWTTTGDGPRWRTVVRHRHDAPPADVLDLLQREHRRIDLLLARAMRLLNEGETDEAAEVLQQFIHGLTRHLYVEDEVLAPVLDSGGATADAIATMRREHAEIAAQLELIGDSLRAGDAGLGETSTYCAILSGTLAKHEQREEQNLFPRWGVVLARRGGAEASALLERVKSLLAE
ncbi:MAG TPA: hemerythrin domain-containing protein [Burkholderiales bacterium]|nr:hemerythrin domain-containing protein [Burkholderiales bacterium]